MGTVTITCVGDAGFGTKVEEYNFSDNGLNRMIVMAQETYLNEDGTQPGPNAANNRLWGGMVRGVKDNVERHDKVKAIEELPPPIPIP